MTREQQEIARCEREMRENGDSPDDQLMRLLGWVDWTIEKQLLTNTEVE